MNYLYPYAQKWATDKQLSQAYYEYMTSASRDYGNIVSLVNEMITMDQTPDDLVGYCQDFLDNNGAGINIDSYVNFNGAITTIADLCVSIRSSIDNELSKISNNQVSNINPDVIINDSVFSMNDVLSKLEANYHAVTVEAAAAEALCFGSDTTSRVSLFRDYISSRFVSAYTDISNTIDSIAENLKYRINIRDFISERLSRSGITEGADTDDVSTSFDESYTGASSSYAAMFHAGKNIIDTAINYTRAACGIIINAFNGLMNAIKRLRNKIDQYAYVHLINPEDIEKINGDEGQHVFDKFYSKSTIDIKDDIISMPELWSQLREGPIHLDFCFSEVIMQLQGYSPFINISDISAGLASLDEFITAKYPSINVHYSTSTPYNTYLSNVCQWLNLNEGIIISDTSIRDRIYQIIRSIKPDAEVTSTDSIIALLQYVYYEVNYGDYHVYVDVVYKVKPVDMNRLINYGSYSLQNPETLLIYINYVGIRNNIDLISQNNDLYNIKTADQYSCMNRPVSSWESYVYYCTVYAHLMAKFELELLLAEAQGVDLSDDSAIMNHFGDVPAWFHLYDYIDDNEADHIKYTNADFVELVGNNKIVSLSGGSKVYSDLTHHISSEPISILDNVLSYRTDHPLDFAFYPYNTKEVQWNIPSWSIIPDAVMQYKLDSWMTKAITIAIVAFVAIKTFGIIKNKLSILEANMLGSEWNVTEAASLGNLTPELIQANRIAKFKYNIAKGLTGNMLVSSTAKVSSGLTSKTNEADVSDVITLIRGY